MSEATLGLGPDVIRLLLPHRRPFVMVDRVEAWQRGETPSLRAGRLVSSNEPVFDGHFPDLHLWPGALTLEGLAQTCHLLHVLEGLARAREQAGGAAGDVIDALRHLERRRRSPGAADAAPPEWLRALLAASGKHRALAAGFELRLLAPVYGGERLDYRARLVRVVDELALFEVEAEVAGRPVATGRVTGARPWP